MNTLYKYLVLLLIYAVASLFVPVLFSMKSDVAVIAAVAIVVSAPWMTVRYMSLFDSLFNKKPNNEV